MHVLDVVGQPGDQPAGGLRLEKGQVQGEQVGEQVLAQPVHHPLADPLEQHHLHEGEHEHGQHQQAVLQGHPAQAGDPFGPAEALGQDGVIDADLHEPRHGQGGRRDRQGEEHGQGERAQVL